jgi:ferrous iron transport protein A
MYLSEVPEGRTARVVGFVGGSMAVRKLMELGIREGSVVRVVRNANIGPIIVEVEGSRIALGRGLASKVLVEVL